MVNCSDFLQDYSSFRDGELSFERWSELRAHRETCATCARYDRVVGGGVELVRGLEPVKPSLDFMDRLQHRIYHVDEEMRASRRASGTSVAFTTAIAASLAITAWAPTLRPKVPQLALPAVAANAPVRTEALPSVFQTGPLLTRDVRAPAVAHPGQSIFFRYSPLGVSSGEWQAVLASQSGPQH